MDLRGAIITFIVFTVLLSLLHIVICIWSYRDCLRRGKSKEYAFIVLFGLLFFPIIGLIVYLVIRKY
ncbi:PLDc N-terminal domain-containing protein [Paenibacillus sp. GP183]|uniref:PLDc N-terminal domain-containing protein n=1 Tax=Paenibacillus sp. GP183 TaxID=1882751 RepID=UPI003450E127